MSWRCSNRTQAWVLALAFAGAPAAGCKPKSSDEVRPAESPTQSPQSPATSPIVFSPDFECDEPAVPELLKEAVRACVAQDYEAFRSLWSAREDPISEKEFIRAWRASPKFNLRKIRKLKTPDGEVVYAVRALVSLDPNEVPEPERDIVLLVVNEHNTWRLKKAPRKLTKMLKEKDEATTSKPTLANTNGK